MKLRILCIEIRIRVRVDFYNSTRCHFLPFAVLSTARIAITADQSPANAKNGDLVLLLTYTTTHSTAAAAAADKITLHCCDLIFVQDCEMLWCCAMMATFVCYCGPMQSFSLGCLSWILVNELILLFYWETFFCRYYYYSRESNIKYLLKTSLL